MRATSPTSGPANLNRALVATNHPAAPARQRSSFRAVRLQAFLPTPVRAYLLALLVAALATAGILFPKAGVAIVLLTCVLAWAARTIRQPLYGIFGAFLFYPICAMLRSSYTAYHLPVWTSGVRLFPEFALVLVFSGLIIRACKHRSFRFQLYSDDLPSFLYLLSGAYGFLIALAYLPLIGPINGWWVSMTPAVFYFAMRFIRPTHADTARLMRFVLITFMVLAIGSFYQYIWRPEWLILMSNAERPAFVAKTNFTVDVFWRIYMRMESLLLEENVWGTLCAFISFYCLTGLRSLKTSWRLIVVLAFALAGMAFSMSRGAWLTFVIGIIVLMLMRGRHRSRIIAALLVTGILGGFVAVRWGQSANVTSMLLTRADTLTSGDAKNNASSDRAFQWAAGWDIFVRNPSGIGLGTVGYAAHLSGVGIHTVADGIYFRILAETGIPGALLTIGALFGTGWVLFRHIFDYACSPPTRRLGLTLFAFHCGFIVQSIGANTYDFWYLPSLFWTIFGVFITLCQRDQIELAKAQARARLDA